MFDNPYFGIVLSFAAYEVGKWINSKIKNPLANPLLIANLLIIGFLLLTNIPYESYKKGGDIISFFIGPATVAMVLDLYVNFDKLKENILAIFVGVFVGSISAMVFAIILSKVFGFTGSLMTSIIPQSITTAIAISLSEEYQGIAALTMMMVVFRGVIGAAMAPSIMKIFKIKDPIAQGIAIGTSSHAVGTSQARKMGKIQGAMSGLSIGLAGILTVLLMPLAMTLVSYL
ncbi:MAG: LrgB family protein [Anaerococcus sp.]|nr:LrgB family protein [Anaerococcus sp.]